MRLTRRSATRSRTFAFVHALTALVVACNYFAFRVELFDEEAEAQRHDLPAGVAFAASSLTWETFDKENAPQAFTIQVVAGSECLFVLPLVPAATLQDLRPFQPIRDKSPPSSFDAAV